MNLGGLEKIGKRFQWLCSDNSWLLASRLGYEDA